MTGNDRRWTSAAIVVLAVAALGVAVRRDGGLDAGIATGSAKDLRPLAAVLAVVVLVVVAVSFAKHRDEGFGPLHRAGTATALLLVAAAVLTPVGVLFIGRQNKPDPPADGADDPAQTADQTMRTPPSTVRTGKPGSHSSLADFFSGTVLALVVVAAIVLIILGVYRMLSGRRIGRLAVPVLAFDELADADLEQLAEAVAAGSEALAYEGDAREAVIACYAAMEDALSADGNGRHETDTPEDFLQRVTGAQLIPAEPARRLTELFREARFSRHPIEEDKREQARNALAAISEHLRARAAEAQARAEAVRTAQAASAGGPR
ncbi:MAG: DUF4129 domain-containing protein [Catenulispora sp.]|nr:DUF4129 domain-containing protein [Catenulispora sp.]